MLHNRVLEFQCFMKDLEHSVTHLARIYMSASCEPGCVWQLLASGAVRLWAHTSCTVSDGVARGVETAVGMYSCLVCYVALYSSALCRWLELCIARYVLVVSPCTCIIVGMIHVSPRCVFAGPMCPISLPVCYAPRFVCCLVVFVLLCY